MTLTSILPSSFPQTKYCRGCEQYLPIDLFGVDNKMKSGISSRCRKCNNEDSKKSYKKNFEKISAKKHEAWILKHPPREKITQINPQFTIPEGNVKKRCPHCRAIQWVYPANSTGKCHKCQKNYTINKVLSDKKSGRSGGIVLKKEIIPRYDYSGEILEYISSKKATCISEIRRELSIGRRIVENTISAFEKEGIVRVVPGKNANWVMVC